MMRACSLYKRYCLRPVDRRWFRRGARREDLRIIRRLTYMRRRRILVKKKESKLFELIKH